MMQQRVLGRSGLSVTPIAFGGYRVDDHTPAHRAALQRALERGVNLIDTSTNYTGGASERLIGQVVAAHQGAAPVIVSKVGYVQGDNLALAMAREAEGRSFPDMVRYQDGCWHCLHPSWIEDQLTRSLERLGRSRLDVYLLHNPEYFLSDAKRRRVGLADARAEFHRRVRDAFGELERQRAAGRIGWYGVSSNTFGAPADDPEAVALDRLRELAGEVGGADNGFSVVQLPLNLFESRPALLPNNASGTRTVLEDAEDGGLGVLVNRPLNAIVRGDLVRLSEATPRGSRVSVADGVQFVFALELEWVASHKLMPGGSAADDLPVDVSTMFNFARELGDAHARGAIQGLAHWREIEERNIWPKANFLLAGVENNLGEHAQEWSARYRTGLGALCDALHDEQAVRAREAYAPLRKALAEVVPEAWAERPLSQLALRTIMDTPGVTAVLVGMRQLHYVDDAVAAAVASALPDARAIYRAIKTIG